MSETTKEINKVTSAIIGICFRLIIYALAILLIYEGVTQGFRFGHEIFYASSVEEAPGHDQNFTVASGETVRAVGQELEDAGLISNQYSFIVQAILYDYEIQPGDYVLNTSMTSREILDELSTPQEEDGDK